MNVALVPADTGLRSGRTCNRCENPPKSSLAFPRRQARLGHRTNLLFLTCSLLGIEECLPCGVDGSIRSSAQLMVSSNLTRFSE
jgi:hypothetical protein